MTLAGVERVERERPRGKYVRRDRDHARRRSARARRRPRSGLAQGLNRIGRKAAVAIRQPSLGPVFGIKGGAAGGGYSPDHPDGGLQPPPDRRHPRHQRRPQPGRAFLDNHLHHGNALGIDPFSIRWPRVVDISDRAIRRAVIGLGGKENGVPREAEWVITVASEVMAILALSRDLFDLRARLGRIVVATTRDGKAVTTEDLGVAGAMTVLLRDAIKPNLLQTLEGGPAYVHCGPFANIAHGNSSILADRVALATSDIVVTEAGFGADMGAEKFFDIKCRASGLRPDAAVVVATVRALKMHGGVGRIVAGKPLDPALTTENVEAVRQGRREPGRAGRDRPRLRRPGRRGHQRLPDRHRRRARGDPRGRPRGRRPRRGRDHQLRRGRQGRRGARRGRLGGGGRRTAAPSSCSTRTRCRCARRSRRSRPGSTGPTASTSPRRRRRRSPSTRPGLRPPAGLRRQDPPLALPRPEPQGPPDRASASRSATSGSPPAPASSTRSRATCGRCRGCPSHPAGEKIDIDADGNVVGLF